MRLKQCWRRNSVHISLYCADEKRFKTDKKRGKDISKLETVLDILLSGEELPDKYKDHQLKGGMQGFRECHIEPDWLLIYRKEEKELILYVAASGRTQTFSICNFINFFTPAAVIYKSDTIFSRA